MLCVWKPRLGPPWPVRKQGYMADVIKRHEKTKNQHLSSYKAPNCVCNSQLSSWRARSTELGPQFPEGYIAGVIMTIHKISKSQTNGTEHTSPTHARGVTRPSPKTPSVHSEGATTSEVDEGTHLWGLRRKPRLGRTERDPRERRMRRTSGPSAFCVLAAVLNSTRRLGMIQIGLGVA